MKSNVSLFATPYARAIVRKQRQAAALVAVPVITLSILITGVVTGQAAEISSGSGVAIGANGEILTNAHVVQGCQSITVKLASGNSELGVLVANDERNDLAVVRLAGISKPFPSVAVFREGVPVRPGDTIVSLGYPLSGLLSSDANLSVGNVSALAGLRDNSRYLQISAPVQPGNSGGPLLDTSGHLVGIVTAKLDAVRFARFTGDIPQNVNFALKAEVARTFLDSKGISYQTVRSDKQLSPAEVGDISRPFTVHIECEQRASQSLAGPIKPKKSPPKQGQSPTSTAAAPSFSATKLAIGGKKGPQIFTVELALNPQQWASGTTFRHKMAADAGMLYVYPTARNRNPGDEKYVYHSRRAFHHQ